MTTSVDWAARPTQLEPTARFSNFKSVAVQVHSRGGERTLLAKPGKYSPVQVSLDLAAALS